MDIDQLYEDNASPLVLKAVSYLQTGSLDFQTVSYENWTVLDQPPN